MMFGNGADHHHRLERGERVERQLQQHRIDRVGVVGEQQGAAVAGLLRDIAGAGGAAGAGAALDDDVLADAVLQLLGEQARRHVGRPAGRERHDDADDVFGADRLGESVAGKRQRQRGEDRRAHTPYSIQASPVIS